MRSKYNAKRTEYNGVGYASKAEAARAQELDLLLKAGEIRDWIGQPTVRLGIPENVYKPDFHVTPLQGYPWYEDVKGMETPKFRRDKKLWGRYGRADLKIIKSVRKQLVVVEVIHPGGVNDDELSSPKQVRCR